MVEERAVERVEEKVVEKPKWRKVFDDYRALSDEILRPDEPKKEKFNLLQSKTGHFFYHTN